MPLVRIQAHIMSVVKKIMCMLDYQGTLKVKKSRESMKQMAEILEDDKESDSFSKNHS